MLCVVRGNRLLQVVFLTNNNTGTGNTANGHLALLNSIDGNTNTAVSRYVGDSITANLMSTIAPTSEALIPTR